MGMSTERRVWARTTINMAGFPVGQRRSVDANDPNIQALFESGRLVQIDDNGVDVPAASPAPPATVDSPESGPEPEPPEENAEEVPEPPAEVEQEREGGFESVEADVDLLDI